MPFFSELFSVTSLVGIIVNLASSGIEKLSDSSVLGKVKESYNKALQASIDETHTYHQNSDKETIVYNIKRTLRQKEEKVQEILQETTQNFTNVGNAIEEEAFKTQIIEEIFDLLEEEEVRGKEVLHKEILVEVFSYFPTNFYENISTETAIYLTLAQSYRQNAQNDEIGKKIDSLTELLTEIKANFTLKAELYNIDGNGNIILSNVHHVRINTTSKPKSIVPIFVLCDYNAQQAFQKWKPFKNATLLELIKGGTSALQVQVKVYFVKKVVDKSDNVFWARLKYLKKEAILILHNDVLDRVELREFINVFNDYHIGGCIAISGDKADCNALQPLIINHLIEYRKTPLSRVIPNTLKFQIKKVDTDDEFEEALKHILETYLNVKHKKINDSTTNNKAVEMSDASLN